MAKRVQGREIDNDEGNRLLRILQGDSASVVTWRRAQMVLLSAQGMDAVMIANVAPATCAACTRPRCASRSCWATLARTRSTTTDTRVADWAVANNVELAYVPFYASWLNRIEAQFTALRYFAPDGTRPPQPR